MLDSNPIPSNHTWILLREFWDIFVGTTNLGLWYEEGTACNVTGYCDADFARDRVERKNTSGLLLLS